MVHGALSSKATQFHVVSVFFIFGRPCHLSRFKLFWGSYLPLRAACLLILRKNNNMYSLFIV